LQGEVRRVRLIVGLGNPGPEYEGTRHNVGFAVLDRLAAEAKIDWRREQKWGAYWLKLGDTFLVKPMTYMNRSGGPLSSLAQFYKVPPEEVMAVFDDMALELGRLRLRLDGSSGGHNGMESIITTFGTDQIARLRFGIGPAPGSRAVDYVLGRFFPEELPFAEKALARAAEVVKWSIDKGVVSAMNTFNKIPES
jgi:PTH1 family peptidyl-tRNA hydrolase